MTPEQVYAEFYYGTYLQQLAEQQLALFRWQNHANEVLLWFVCAITLSGIVLAAAQLYWSFKLGKMPTESSQTEISATSMKIQSPFVGLVILFLSFAFFMLFVHEVYTIKPSSQGSSQTNSQSNIQNNPVVSDY